MDPILVLLLCFGLLYGVHVLYQFEKSNSSYRIQTREKIKNLELTSVSDDNKWLLGSLLHLISLRKDFFLKNREIAFDPRERHTEVRKLKNQLEVNSTVYDMLTASPSRYIDIVPVNTNKFSFYLECICNLVFKEEDPTISEIEFLKKIGKEKLGYQGEYINKFLKEHYNYPLNKPEIIKEKNMQNNLQNSSPTSVDDMIIHDFNDALYQRVLESQFEYSKSISLKEGWNSNPDYPIKIFRKENSIENFSDIPENVAKLGVLDHEFAWTNYLNWISEDFFFHPLLKMQIPKEHLDKIVKGDYYHPRDFESKEILGNRLERHYWSLINSFLLSSDKDLDSVKTVLFCLKQINNIYSAQKRFDEAIQLNQFALSLAKEKETLYNLGINYIKKNDLEKGYSYLLQSCKTYIKEDHEIPSDIVYEYLAVSYSTNKRKQAEEELKEVEDIDFEIYWSRIHNDLALNSLLNNEQKTALKTFFQILIELSDEPHRSEKAQRLKLLSERINGINWDEIRYQEDIIDLVKDKKEGFHKTLVDMIFASGSFKSISLLSEEIRQSILEMIRMFLNPLKANGMFIETTGVQPIISLVFSMQAQLACNDNYAKSIFTDSKVNYDSFYAYWGLTNPGI